MRRPTAGVRGARWALLLTLLLAGLTLAGCAAGGGSATGVLGPPAGETSTRTAGATCPAPSPDAPGAVESRLPVRSLCALPPEAAPVWRIIADGGRPAYPQDGGVFGNFERRLPRHERGYYREYTVPTPGSRDRGARRLVSGKGRELYYTADHYDSFVVVDPNAT